MNSDTAFLKRAVGEDVLDIFRAYTRLFAKWGMEVSVTPLEKVGDNSWQFLLTIHPGASAEPMYGKGILEQLYES